MDGIRAAPQRKHAMRVRKGGIRTVLRSRKVARVAPSQHSTDLGTKRLGPGIVDAHRAFLADT